MAPVIPWHLRRVRLLIHIGLAVAAAGIAAASLLGAAPGQSWVVARQLYGLWALALLLAAMVPGPLRSVLPWFPLSRHLALGRRALGVAAFAMAVLHVACYVGPTCAREWDALWAPGPLWILGLVLGLVLLPGLGLLAVTSRDASVRRLGPRRWKRIHRLVYILLPLALAHAACVGADFGLNKGPDVTADVDAGCLVTMVLSSAAWMTLWELRRRRVSWTPRLLRRESEPGPSRA